MAVPVASAVLQSPTNRPDLVGLRARQRTIRTDPPQELVTDGEMLVANPAAITFRPGALRVLAPLPPP